MGIELRLSVREGDGDRGEDGNNDADGESEGVYKAYFKKYLRYTLSI